MKSNDMQEDPVLAVLTALRTHDVSSAHAQRLRRRCHRGLTSQRAAPQVEPGVPSDGLPHAARVVAGAWCLVYLLETIRRAAAVYGF